MSEEKNPVHVVVVGAVVRDEQNRVLLIKHHRRGWEIPQGRVEEGENLIDALHREVQEEAGVKIEIGPLACIWSMVALPPALIFTFLGSYVSGNLGCCGDSADACWASVDEALELVTSPVMRDRLQAALAFDGTTIYRSYTPKPYAVLVEQPLSAGCGAA